MLWLCTHFHGVHRHDLDSTIHTLQFGQFHHGHRGGEGVVPAAAAAMPSKSYIIIISSMD